MLKNNTCFAHKVYTFLATQPIIPNTAHVPFHIEIKQLLQKYNLDFLFTHKFDTPVPEFKKLMKQLIYDYDINASLNHINQRFINRCSYSPPIYKYFR